MPAEAVDVSRYSFLFLVALARASAILIPLGVPGLQRIAPMPKVILALTLAGLVWSRLDAAAMDGIWQKWLLAPVSTSLLIVGSELGLGLCCGLAVSLMIESASWAMQLVGLNAGYQFASTFDPNSEADSTVLPVLGQLFGGLLFFASGLYQYLIFALLQNAGPRSQEWLSVAEMGPALSQAGTQLFVLSLKLALPIVGLLVMIDLGMALMNRIHAQLNLISVTFPAKMLLTLAVLIQLAGGWSLLIQKEAGAWTRLLLERPLALAGPPG